MSGNCDECGVEYIQFKATSSKNNDGFFQTKRYYRCPKCDTIYVETDPVQDGNFHQDNTIVEKFKPVEIKPVSEETVQTKLM